MGELKSTAEQFAEVFDKTQALRSVGDDPESFTEVVGLMQAAWPTLLADIRKSVDREDFSAVKMAARLAKAAARNLSAKRAYESARQLEEMAEKEDLPAARKTSENLQLEVELLELALNAWRLEPGMTLKFSYTPAKLSARWPGQNQVDLPGRCAMSLDVRIHETDTHLSIKAVGEYTMANLFSLFNRVSEESENRAKRRVVLDVTEVSGTIPVMDLYQLGEDCSRVWKSGLRIALVSPAGGIDKFFEDVAWNRGVQLSVVPDQSAAVDWVNSKH